MPTAELEVLFGAAALAILYTYLGYPLLLALAAKLRPAPAVRKAPIRPKVCIVLVAHNEESRLADKIRNCLDLAYPPERRSVLVVSDGSSDRTEEIARSFAGQGVRLVSIPRSAGKAAALNRVLPGLDAEAVLLCDVRQRLADDALARLVENLADPSVGAVSGELHLEAEPGSPAGEGVGFYWRYEKLIRRLESRLDSVVGVTGAIYALRPELFRTIDPRTILDDVSIPMDVVLAGRRIVFEPLARAHDRTPSRPRDEYRRKVRTLAGNFQLVALRPELLLPWRNRLFWQLVSHKLLRLAVPWLLLLVLGSSAALALRGAPVYGVAFLAQLGLYLLAALAATRVGSHTRAPRVAYAFVLLNLAAAAAPFAFLRGSARAAWRASSRPRSSRP